ncbi:hypothetical protein evm_014839, partial [Chilo suppressalis]
LEPFVRAHAFEPAPQLAAQLLAHFKDELKWQAAKILGSVDFLGNPLGFVADVSEGVTGLLLEGNVAALLQNVTHGLSNSAAKVTESLGDGLERVVSDEAHEETRRRIRSAAPGAHLAAGFRGLGLGILGILTHSLPMIIVSDAAPDPERGARSAPRRRLPGTRARHPRLSFSFCIENDKEVPLESRCPEPGAAVIKARPSGTMNESASPVAPHDALLSWNIVTHTIRAVAHTKAPPALINTSKNKLIL